MKNTEIKPRESNFELLRIISMLLIVSAHYCEFGFSVPEEQTLTFNYLFLRFFGFGDHMGVDLFVLISGYFLVDQRFSLKRVFRLWLQTAAVVLLWEALQGGFCLRSVKNAVFAIPNGAYWFVTSYFLLYLSSDYLDIMLHAIGRRGHLVLIILLLTVYSVLPTCLGMRMDSSNFMLFVMLYVIAAYIRIYAPKQLESKHCLIAGVGLHWLCFAVSAVLVALGSRNTAFLHIANRMSAASDITIIICAVLIFCGFRNLDIGCSIVINELGASTFGIYLLHASTFVMSDVLVGLLHTPDYFESPMLIPHALLSVMMLFCGSAIIDMLFRRTVLNPLMGRIGNRWEGLEKKLHELLPPSFES